jgi:hypothetical protein
MSQDKGGNNERVKDALVLRTFTDALCHVGTVIVRCSESCDVCGHGIGLLTGERY